MHMLIPKDAMSWRRDAFDAVLRRSLETDKYSYLAVATYLRKPRNDHADAVDSFSRDSAETRPYGG